MKNLLLSFLFLISIRAFSQSSDSLVALYYFNGNVLDTSGHNNNGMSTGVQFTSDRFGKLNKACNFDGSSSYIDCGNSNDFNFGSESFTLSAWVNLASYNTTQLTIVSKERRNEAATQFTLAIAASNYNITSNASRAFFVMSDNLINTEMWTSTNGYLLNSVDIIQLNQWTHIAVTRCGNIFNMYINGVLKSTYTLKTPPMNHSNANNFRIGARYQATSGTNPVDFFNGKIDDLRIYKRCLDASDVNKLYTAFAVGIDNDLAGTTSLTLYPNPSKDVIYINGLNGMRSIKVYDLTGNEMLTASTTRQVDISSLCEGVYFLKTCNEGENSFKTMRFFKQ